jgi:hypothetical protein
VLQKPVRIQRNSTLLPEESIRPGLLQQLRPAKFVLTLTLSLTTIGAVFAYSKAGDGGRVGSNETIAIPEKVSQIADFAPSGWHVFKSARGELNQDGRTDLACILVKDGDDPEGFADQSAEFKRVVVVALAQPDGSFVRDAVGYGAIMSGEIARNFALSVADVRIERGNVVVTNGNSATYIETHDCKYRKQKGQYELIGITRNYACIREDDQFSATVDRNLNISYVEDNLTRRKSSKAMHYYALRAGLTSEPPVIDGTAAAGEWNGQVAHLKRADCVALGKKEWWKNAADLSAALQAKRTKDSLYVCADLTGSRITENDDVQLIDDQEKVIAPAEIKRSTSGGHETIECRFQLDKIPKHCYINNELNPSRLNVSVEVVCHEPAGAGASEKNMPLILSTSCGGRDYTGEISLCEKSSLPLLSDWSWQYPDD